MKAARDSSAARQGVWKAGQGDLSAAPGFSLLSDTQDVGGDRVSAAIGVAVFPDDAGSARSLFEVADARQREDKPFASGREPHFAR